MSLLARSSSDSLHSDSRPRTSSASAFRTSVIARTGRERRGTAVGLSSCDVFVEICLTPMPSPTGCAVLLVLFTASGKGRLASVSTGLDFECAFLERRKIRGKGELGRLGVCAGTLAVSELPVPEETLDCELEIFRTLSRTWLRLRQLLGG